MNVVDTEYVKQGDVLVQLDDTDARLALLQAEADLALAKRRVRSYLANDEGLSAMVEAQEANEQRVKAQLKAAQADFERAKIDLSRREDLVRSGSVSGEELTNAKPVLRRHKQTLMRQKRLWRKHRQLSSRLLAHKKLMQR